MARRLKGAAGALAAALLLFLGACSFSESISTDALHYNRSVEQAANAQVLLNVLRARDFSPMHFTAVNQVRGSYNVQTGGNVSLQIPFGGDAMDIFPLTPSVNLSRSQSPSFDLAILDSQTFTRGILRPIALDTMEYYWQQRWPQDLLFHAFIHQVEEKPGEGDPMESREDTRPEAVSCGDWLTFEHERKAEGRRYTRVCNDRQGQPDEQVICQTWYPAQDGKPERRQAVYTYVNNPGDGRFVCFKKWIEIMDRRELVVDRVDTARGIGPMLAPNAEELRNVKDLVKIEEQSLRLVKVTEEFKAEEGQPATEPAKVSKRLVGYQMCKIGDRAQFCYGRCGTIEDFGKECRGSVVEEAATVVPLEVFAREQAEQSTRQSSESAGQATVKAPDHPEYTIHLRSASALLFYFGELVRFNEKASKPVEIHFGPDRRPAPLFVLKRQDHDEPADPSLSVDYQGQTYIVPKEGGGFTRTAIALASQLLGLHKVAEELPSTEAVQLLGQ